MPIVRHVKYARKQDHNVYIGHKMDDYTGMRLRDASILNNPFPIANYNDEHERQESIKQYRVWLYQHLRDTNTYRSAPYWNALRQIQESSVLLCHCYPRHCHGHIIIKAWQWAKEQGLIEPVHTNHTSDQTLKHVAAAVVQETEETRIKRERALAAAYQKPVQPAQRNAPGPLPMEQITKAIADARLDEQLLETHAMDCPHCVEKQEPVNSLHRSLPPKKKQGRGAPRKPRGIMYAKADIRYNRLDEIAADLAELYATSAYIAETRETAAA